VENEQENQILLNRAKALNSNEYIISQSIKIKGDEMYLYSKVWKEWISCDKSTRSISLSNMIDSEDARIFASLSEDGKGGDILSHEYIIDFTLKHATMFNIDFEEMKFKILGIQK
jgi:hypothetical protein